MNAVEIAVIVVGLLAGYWLVGFMFKGKAAPQIVTSPDAPSAPGWPEVLGVNADASVDDIRSAYKRLMSQYHPDKVASLGVELQELAERKSKDIAVAYQQALAERGAAE